MEINKIKKITDFDVKGKRVLMRCGFDVGLDENNRVIDDFRIKEAVPSIEYLIKNKAKVILMSHLGSPGGAKRSEFSLAPVQEKLLEYLDCSVTKADDCFGAEIEQWIKEMSPGEVLLLENLRFHAGEEEDSAQFARSLARLADIFINDAFSVSHRKHASVVGVPLLLPSGIGFLFEKEMEALSRVTENPQRPAVGIIGGAKLKSKIKPIKNLLNKVDFLLVAGKIGNEILIKKGAIKGKLDDAAGRLLEEIDLNNPKLILPLDAAVFENSKKVVRRLGEIGLKDLIFGIGPKTIEEFCQKISAAKTIFWAGPISNLAEKEFIGASLAVAQAIGKASAFSVAGGGDTLAFLRKNNLDGNFSYISTGGGAMLEYLAEGTLPGIEALKKHKK